MLNYYLITQYDPQLLADEIQSAIDGVGQGARTTQVFLHEFNFKTERDSDGHILYVASFFIEEKQGELMQ